MKPRRALFATAATLVIVAATTVRLPVPDVRGSTEPRSPAPTVVKTENHSDPIEPSPLPGSPDVAPAVPPAPVDPPTGPGSDAGHRREPAGPILLASADPPTTTPGPGPGAEKPAGPPPRLNVAEIVARCEASVAVVEGKRGTGTGFLVRRRLLVTNAHVVADEVIKDVRVRFPSATNRRQGPLDAELIFQDPGRDLAFFAVKTELPPLPLAESFQYVKGEDVLVIGSPGGLPGTVLENAVSRGVMSTRAVINGRNFYQLNIAVNPGNSGGPVFDPYGRVIGVVTLKIAQREGIAFCIPIEELLPEVIRAERQMRSMASRGPEARDRSPQRAKPGAAPIKRQPRPDAKAVDDARLEVRKLFEADVKRATLAEQQSDLAEKLLGLARETEGDGAAQYALFEEARALAMRAGEMEQSLRITDSMRETFDGLEQVSLELETLEEVARHLRLESDRVELAKTALERLELSIKRDDYEGARRLLGLAKLNGKPLNTLEEEVEASTKLVDVLGGRFKVVEPQMKSLEKAPEDPGANLAVGTYVALWKGEWERGLPMLAKGGKEKLAELARRDLADPAEPIDQGRLGDAWWDEAGTLEGRPRSFAMARAVLWYDRSVDALPGLAKVRARKRLEEHGSTVEPVKADRAPRSPGSGRGSRPGLVAEFFLGSDFQRRLTWRIDPTVDFDWRDGSPDPAVPKDFFGARWTGYLRPPVAGTYTLKIKCDNGTRWTLGDRVLYDQLSVNGQHEHEVMVELKNQPQLMKLDFLEGVFTAWCRLSWRRPGQTEYEPIPADCFSHTRDQEPPPAGR